ncbi:MAG: toxin Fic [Peptococcaceae bacterium BRH_c4b]|nr:MAG: toxin Fic [Peptococcaceae bacterium BRH_c4b]
MSFKNRSELMMYQTDDGETKINVRLENETVWLSLNQMSELFQRDKSVISKHIKNVYQEGELDEKSTVAIFAIVQNEGDRSVERNIAYYNLDVIISVGYRVKSHRGTQFRIWATQRLKEYIIKGFTMNDDLLKKAGGGNYFDELLERIRDIRSSEKVFWRKVLEIYATSIDYDPRVEASKKFFQTVQNKMHWAVHGHTAAEIISLRANADKPLMGLTVFSCSKPRKTDVTVAKNYLNEEEIDLLNRIVSMYLDFAEMQAKRKRTMYMKDWIEKLDDFLRLGEHEILTHAGKVSHEDALKKANAEYEKYVERTKNELSRVERHFLDAIDNTAKRIEGKKGRSGSDGM